MNANEVIANRAIELARRRARVARRRSTPTITSTRASRRNDTFPTAMHVAAVRELARAPAARPSTALRDDAGRPRRRASPTSSMIGRTHLQDATPITLGQVIGGWVAQIDDALDDVRYAA